MGGFRGALALLGVLATVIGLTGCGSPQVVAPSATAAPVASATPTPTPTQTQPPVPHLVPGGTAEQNQPYFDSVNKKLFAAQPQAAGRAIIDNLVAAGFDKSAMQVTPDTTPTRKNTDSIEFSVQVGTDCLIGQTGGGEYTSVVGPALATGGCLIGKTRPIDW